MINFPGLKNKTIFISGASSETGIAISLFLHSQGAKIILSDFSEERIEVLKLHPILGQCPLLLVDYTKPSEMEAQLKPILPQYSPISGLVFCGGKGGVRPIGLTNNAFASSMIEVNAESFIELVRCVARKNLFESGGSIVAISSVSSTRGLKSKTAYAASKAALDASVRCIAKELGDRKIRVNSIQKGWVSADMNSEFIKNNIELNNNDDIGAQFLGIIEPEDMAYSVGFLLSDASKFITGIQLVVDGGYNL